MTITEKKPDLIECFSCMETEGMMPGLRMCKVCYGKAYDILSFDENGNPQFQTMEEMERFAEALKKYPANKSLDEPVEKKSRKKKAAKPADPADEGRVTVANRDFIWESRHFYTRKNDVFVNTRQDAKQSKALANETNTVVFAHSHVFGEACEPNCTEV